TPAPPTSCPAPPVRRSAHPPDRAAAMGAPRSAAVGGLTSDKESGGRVLRPAAVSTDRRLTCPHPRFTPAETVQRALGGKLAHGASRIPAPLMLLFVKRLGCSSFWGCRPPVVPGGFLQSMPGATRNLRGSQADRNHNGCGNGSQFARELHSLPPSARRRRHMRAAPPAAFESASATGSGIPTKDLG